MRILYQDFVCTTEWSTKNVHKVIEVVLKEIRIKADKLLKAVFANYMLLEGKMVAQIQVAYVFTMFLPCYSFLTYDIKKNDGICPFCWSQKF